MAGKLKIVLGVVIGACAVVLAPSIAMAQAYPTKPVRFVVPYPPGGPEGLAKIIRGEMVIYGNIIKAAHIKPE